MEERAAQDQRLVRSILEGDHEAYAEIVAQYQKLVASVAWRYGVDRDAIEDVVSEVFIKAYGNLHRFRPDHAFSTWLYRLAVNHVIDRGRREKRQPGRGELKGQIRDAAQDQGRDLEQRERARILRDALEEIPAHYREVLFLVYIEGMLVTDAARTAGLPSGTIKTRLMRGREALRKVLVRTHPEYFGA